MDWLINLDKELLLALNGLHSPLFDYFMYIISRKEVWLLFYVTIIVVILKGYGWRCGGTIVVAIVLTILLSDQITAEIIKPFFERFRPSRDPILSDMVHTVNNYRGGKFGFVSSHAANTFALAIFSTLLFRNRYLSVFMLFWAGVVSYSRIYLGVHYPGDIIVGAFVGAIIGTIIYRIHNKFVMCKFSHYANIKSSRLSINMIIIIGSTIFATLLLVANEMI